MQPALKMLDFQSYHECSTAGRIHRLTSGPDVCIDSESGGTQRQRIQIQSPSDEKGLRSSPALCRQSIAQQMLNQHVRMALLPRESLCSLATEDGCSKGLPCACMCIVVHLQDMWLWIRASTGHEQDAQLI